MSLSIPQSLLLLLAAAACTLRPYDPAATGTATSTTSTSGPRRGRLLPPVLSTPAPAPGTAATTNISGLLPAVPLSQAPCILF